MLADTLAPAAEQNPDFTVAAFPAVHVGHGPDLTTAAELEAVYQAARAAQDALVGEGDDAEAEYEAAGDLATAAARAFIYFEATDPATMARQINLALDTFNIPAYREEDKADIERLRSLIAKLAGGGAPPPSPIGPKAHPAIVAHEAAVAVLEGRPDQDRDPPEALLADLEAAVEAVIQDRASVSGIAYKLSMMAEDAGIVRLAADFDSTTAADVIADDDWTNIHALIASAYLDCVALDEGTPLPDMEERAARLVAGRVRDIRNGNSGEAGDPTFAESRFLAAARALPETWDTVCVRALAVALTAINEFSPPSPVVDPTQWSAAWAEYLDALRATNAAAAALDASAEDESGGPLNDVWEAASDRMLDAVGALAQAPAPDLNAVAFKVRDHLDSQVFTGRFESADLPECLLPLANREGEMFREHGEHWLVACVYRDLLALGAVAGPSYTAPPVAEAV
ncbi:MAG: hypothetical protein JWP35_4649 [Caulobacter sp.]|nr:hypothetical protein [Caulobacter sp.]